MRKVSILLSVLFVMALCVNLCACGTVTNNDQTVPNTQQSNTTTETTLAETEGTTTAASEETTSAAQEETTSAATEETEPAATEETEPVISVKDPVDIETTGGVVIVGTVGFDDAGWYIAPEQPLNISYEYFLDNPSVFPEQTSIRLIDPKASASCA